MKKLLFLFLIISGIALPFISFAGLPDFNGPYVICGTKNPLTPDCTLCDIFKMAQKIIDLIIGAIIIVGPILIAVGGLMILFAGADPGLLAKGKSVIKNVIIGLIIALLAWTVINMIFNELTTSYGTKSAMPWNKIECSGGGVITPPETPPVVTEGDYCACEAPVYDLNPNQYPNQATIIGTNIKVTKLANKNTCKIDCIKASAEYYCPSALKMDVAKLYCTTETDVKSKKVHAVQIKRSTMCQISTNQCWAENEKDKCTASVTPEAGSLFSPAYARKCFVNGEALCDAKKWSPAAFYCPRGASSLCPIDKPYTLYRYAREVGDGTGEMDALKCSTYGSSSWSCRLNFQLNECIDSVSESCQQSFSVSPSSGCSDISKCVDISNYTPTHGCESNSGKCLASSPAASRIQSFISKFKSIAGSNCSLRISSTIQGSGGPSISPCHKPGNSNSGTCVDFNLSNHENCYKAFYQAAKESSAVVSFLDEYVNKCLPANATGGNIHTNF